MSKRFYELTGKTATPEEFLACARTYIKTPYRDWGRSKGKAADCIGLAIMVAHELDLFRGDFTKYSPTPLHRHAENCADAYMRETLWVRENWGTDQPMKWDAAGGELGFTPPGAVGLFWYSNRKEPTHFAVFGEHPLMPGVTTMVHAHSSFREVVENRVNDFWWSRLVKTYWMPGVFPSKVASIAS